MNTSVREKLEGYLGHKWGLTCFPYPPTLTRLQSRLWGYTKSELSRLCPTDRLDRQLILLLLRIRDYLHFSYDSNDTNVVSFSGNVATALAVGKVRITATQAGNSNWLIANAYQDWIVTATPRSDQNITFAAIPNKNACLLISFGCQRKLRFASQLSPA